jgi:hypothetical protein
MTLLAMPPRHILSVARQTVVPIEPDSFRGRLTCDDVILIRYFTLGAANAGVDRNGSQSINQSINQSSNQSINQSINQAINHSHSFRQLQ